MCRVANPVLKAESAFLREAAYQTRATPRNQNPPRVFQHPFPRAVPAAFSLSDECEIHLDSSKESRKLPQSSPPSARYPLRARACSGRAYKQTNSREVFSGEVFSRASPHRAARSHTLRALARRSAPRLLRFVPHKSSTTADAARFFCTAAAA